MKQKIVVIGGGAAGFFAAANIPDNPEIEVIIIEKSSKVLSKVRVSGGGRCNVTHDCIHISEMIKNYPRGSRQLKNSFHKFFVNDTIEWFQNKQVKLKVEEDGRMFPVTDNSETIIECLQNEINKKNVKLWLNCEVIKVEGEKDNFVLHLRDGQEILCNRILITAGGHPKLSGYDWLAFTNHKIESPVPSLFTFNLPSNPITKLMGVAVENAEVKIAGTKLKQKGPVLITHWGFSGPAVLKLSAWGARELFEMDYKFTVLINWIPDFNYESLNESFEEIRTTEGGKQVGSKNPFNLPKRLWEFLLTKAAINENTRWADLSRKNLNVLINLLLNDTYEANGKTTFKEEFVTCGGISLEEVDFNTMESKKLTGVFFAGEVLNIDGVTGGFNFQAAWTTGWIASQNIIT